MTESRSTPLPHPDRARLILVSGKGGVGKSCVAAALARVAARSGRRVVVVEPGALTALRETFRVRHIGFEPLQLDDAIWGVNLDPTECLGRYIADHVHIRRIARAIAGNATVNRFLHTAPAVFEVAYLHAVRNLLVERGPDGPRFDQVVVDLPASGHSLSFLQVPRRIEQLVRAGPLRKVAARYRAMLEDAGTTRLHLVALPEELPVNETVETWRTLQQTVGVPLGALFLNRFRRPPDDDRNPVAGVVPPGMAGLAGELADFARVESEWHSRDEGYRRRLSETTGLPVVTLPLVVGALDSAAVVAGLVRHLTAEMG